MADIPKWRVQGDWFDTCNCSIPCPCTFAQPPTSGICDGILAWHIRKGNYGDVRLDGLSVMALGTFKGNIWDGQTKASMAMFIDERADGRQREALQMIFGGRVGGWPGTFANTIGDVRGMEFARIDFHVDDDLAVAGRDSRQIEVERRSHRRTDDAARQAGASAQRRWLRNRSRRCRDLRESDRRQGGRLRLQVGSHRAVEQAHRIRLVRPRRLMAEASRAVLSGGRCGNLKSGPSMCSRHTDDPNHAIRTHVIGALPPL